MANGSITRRKFLLGTLCSIPPLLLADAAFLEPSWLRVRTLRMGNAQPGQRFVHFTDLHHKGNAAFLGKVVQAINSLHPDFVVFTGDLIEEAQHLEGALDGLSKIESPLVGVPGNHDYWAKISFSPIAKCFAKNGGAWLMDDQWTSPDGRWTVTGETCLGAPRNSLLPRPGTRNLLLVHYPVWAKKLGRRTYDLILAGHSHGGQVRLPFFGSIVTPFNVDEYSMGMFTTPGGPLYVNPGIGWFFLPFRFRCRPELTVFEW
jgi:predicted MPP superfamily phosphohydrolase